MKLKSSIIRTLLYCIVILSFCGVAIADTATVDTVHKDLVVGTITMGEFRQNLINYLSKHPEMKEQLEAVKRDTVPAYIKLDRLKPNPNYKAPAYEEELYQPYGLPSAYELNLPGPILNQGGHGTCVTFSMLGAVANSNNSSRYMSEEQNKTPALNPSASCFLQMLYSNGQNAWEGYWIEKILPWVKNQGIIPQELASTGFCNSSYPNYYLRNDAQTYAPLNISTDTYISQSHKIPAEHIKTTWTYNANNALNIIKQQVSDSSNIGVSQRRGYYSLFAFYVNIATEATMLADGRIYRYWAYPSTNYIEPGGHAVFAYGYDDNVVIKGQKGVLFVRNSWGADTLSPEGNYFMTYEYFLKNFRTDEPIVGMYANCIMAGPPRVGCRN